jgi:hypothetical protein
MTRASVKINKTAGPRAPNPAPPNASVCLTQVCLFTAWAGSVEAKPITSVALTPMRHCGTGLSELGEFPKVFWPCVADTSPVTQPRAGLITTSQLHRRDAVSRPVDASRSPALTTVPLTRMQAPSSLVSLKYSGLQRPTFMRRSVIIGASFRFANWTKAPADKLGW